jgi:hypothetical protein
MLEMTLPDDSNESPEPQPSRFSPADTAALAAFSADLSHATDSLNLVASLLLKRYSTPSSDVGQLPHSYNAASKSSNKKLAETYFDSQDNKVSLRILRPDVQDAGFTATDPISGTKLPEKPSPSKPPPPPDHDKKPSASVPSPTSATSLFASSNPSAIATNSPSVDSLSDADALPDDTTLDELLEDDSSVPDVTPPPSNVRNKPSSDSTSWRDNNLSIAPPISKPEATTTRQKAVTILEKNPLHGSKAPPSTTPTTNKRSQQNSPFPQDDNPNLRTLYYADGSNRHPSDSQANNTPYAPSPKKTASVPTHSTDSHHDIKRTTVFRTLLQSIYVLMPEPITLYAAKAIMSAGKIPFRTKHIGLLPTYTQDKHNDGSIQTTTEPNSMILADLAAKLYHYWAASVRLYPPKDLPHCNLLRLDWFEKTFLTFISTEK